MSARKKWDDSLTEALGYDWRLFRRTGRIVVSVTVDVGPPVRVEVRRPSRRALGAILRRRGDQRVVEALLRLCCMPDTKRRVFGAADRYNLLNSLSRDTLGRLGGVVHAVVSHARGRP